MSVHIRPMFPINSPNVQDRKFFVCHEDNFLTQLKIIKKLFYLLLLVYLSGWNKKGGLLNDESKKAFVKTKEYVWRHNKDYVGGVT